MACISLALEFAKECMLLSVDLTTRSAADTLLTDLRMSEPGIEPGFTRPQRVVLTSRRFGPVTFLSA